MLRNYITMHYAKKHESCSAPGVVELLVPPIVVPG